MATKTPHDLRQEQEERDRHWRARARELRGALMRECPSGRYLDVEHLASCLGESCAMNRGALAHRRFIVRAWHEASYPPALIQRALALSAEEHGRFAGPIEWWDPPADMVKDLPEEYRSLLVGARE